MNKLFIVGALLACTTLAGCGAEVIDAGHRGVKKTMGKVDPVALSEGLYFYNPFTSDIIEINVQTIQSEGETVAYTKDVQQATIKYVLTYSVNPAVVPQVYENIGRDWSEKLVIDMVPDSLKNVVGGQEAVEMISKRGTLPPAIMAMLKSRIAAKAVEAGLPEDTIRLSSFAISDIKFEPAFEKAVEDKVTAVQRAEQEKNNTVQVQEKANQQVIAAEAEAKSMTIRAQALSQNKNLVEWEAVQKWDGTLPTYMMGGTTPFINVTPEK